MATPLELNQAFINVWDGILDINNNLKLKDAENVKLTGNQTISGIKTFSVPPVSATNPSSNNQVANKGYVDNAIALAVTGEIDPETSAFVTKEGDQEIGGIKTFNQSPIVPDLVWEDEFDNAEPPELITAASPDGAVVNRKSLEEAIAAIDITDSVGGMIADAIDEALFIDDKPIYVTAIGNDPQDVNGVKTFISSPVVPTPTTNMQAATKKYVDDEIINAISGGEIDLSGFVDTTTNQTIAGVKTFSSNPISTAIQLNAVNALTRKDYVDTQLGTKADQSDLTNLTIRVTNLEDLTVFEEHMDTNPII